MTETEIRSALFCQRYGVLGGSIELTLMTRILKDTIELLTVFNLQGSRASPEERLSEATNRVLKKAMKELKLSTYEIVEVQNVLTPLVIKFYKTIDMSAWLPILGPSTMEYKIQDSFVTLEFSGLFRTETSKEIHALCFSPYSNYLDMMNDPLNILKADILHQYGAFVTVHNVATPDDERLIFSANANSDYRKHDLDSVKHLVLGMQMGLQTPKSPCPFAGCPFSNRCSPVQRAKGVRGNAKKSVKTGRTRSAEKLRLSST